jgi:hypothetical protein
MNSTRPAFSLRSLCWPFLLLACGCASLQPAATPEPDDASAVAAAPKPTDILAYFETLDRLAPGDATRQATELASSLAASEQNPTSSNRLRYAIALGAAGHPASNPVEGKRLLSELLAGTNDLRPAELSLANAYLREFDARVTLYADMARQREEAQKELQALDAESDRRYSAANAEAQRLRKALAEAERKLEAVAEMERALIEGGSEAGPPGERTPTP